MTTWNYRVVHHQLVRGHVVGDPPAYAPLDAGDEYSIHEVFYDDAGGVTKMTVDAMPVYADTVDGVRWVLDKMREACDKPVLEYDVDKLADDPQPEESRDAS